MQQVFLQLYISLPTLDIGRPLKCWLFQVARNQCLDELRRKRAIHFSELEVLTDEDESAVLTFVPDPHPLPEEIVEHHDLQERLLRAIKSLPPRFRSVVFLRYFAQLTYPEIAQALGMPEATAKPIFSCKAFTTGIIGMLITWLRSTSGRWRGSPRRWVIRYWITHHHTPSKNCKECMDIS